MYTVNIQIYYTGTSIFSLTYSDTLFNIFTSTCIPKITFTISRDHLPFIVLDHLPYIILDHLPYIILEYQSIAFRGIIYRISFWNTNRLHFEAPFTVYHFGIPIDCISSWNTNRLHFEAPFTVYHFGIPIECILRDHLPYIILEYQSNAF